MKKPIRYLFSVKKYFLHQVLICTCMPDFVGIANFVTVLLCLCKISYICRSFVAIIYIKVKNLNYKAAYWLSVFHLTCMGPSIK